jgi:diguanylate cyclase (GGDEF)-like protein
LTTQQAVVAVLGAAIVANLVLAIGLIVAPRIRARRRGAARTSTGGGEGMMGVGPGRPVAVGQGTPFAPRFVSPSDPARAGGWLEATGAGPFDRLRPAPTDPATGLDLAPAWSKWLEEEGARIGRYGRPATVILVEVAGLDRLAERLGPGAADRLIPPIATTMRRHARASDNIARLGPARFGALLPETDEIRAINYVERARSACDVWLEAGAVALRLSIGWAEIGANQPVAVAVQTAERRLNEERQRFRPRPDLEVVDAEAEAEAEAETKPDATPESQA